MGEERIDAYIHQRLVELDKQKDMHEAIYKVRGLIYQDILFQLKKEERKIV